MGWPTRGLLGPVEQGRLHHEAGHSRQEEDRPLAANPRRPTARAPVRVFARCHRAFRARPGSGNSARRGAHPALRGLRRRYGIDLERIDMVVLGQPVAEVGHHTVMESGIVQLAREDALEGPHGASPGRRRGFLKSRLWASPNASPATNTLTCTFSSAMTPEPPNYAERGSILPRHLLTPCRGLRWCHECRAPGHGKSRSGGRRARTPDRLCGYVSRRPARGHGPFRPLP
ncbi:hypothetical protein SAMN05216489_00442 [Streptomyces sp. 3213]|nr:hypothetical protein SAMN05216489_00442 [Streptomyces sp. 3213] [Streptomyces sp. 3213.3]